MGTKSVTLRNKKNLVTIEYPEVFKCARHRDGILFWRPSEGFETYDKLDATSEHGVHAPGGQFFCWLHIAKEGENFETVSSDYMRRRGLRYDAKPYPLLNLPLENLSFEWTDGVSDVRTVVAKITEQLFFLLEDSCDSFRGNYRSYDVVDEVLNPISTLRITMHYDVEDVSLPD